MLKIIVCAFLVMGLLKLPDAGVEAVDCVACTKEAAGAAACKVEPAAACATSVGDAAAYGDADGIKKALVLYPDLAKAITEADKAQCGIITVELATGKTEFSGCVLIDVCDTISKATAAPADVTSLKCKSCSGDECKLAGAHSASSGPHPTASGQETTTANNSNSTGTSDLIFGNLWIYQLMIIIVAKLVLL